MHLFLSCIGAHYEGNDKHAQEIMGDLGITYQHSTPQSIMDGWQFWNCKNVPEELPNYISKFDGKAIDAIGWGLSEEIAKKISESEKEN